MLALAGLASLGIYHGLVPPMAAQMGMCVTALLAVITAERVIPFKHPWRQTASIERRVNATSFVVLMTLVDPVLKQGVMPLLLSLTVWVSNQSVECGLAQTLGALYVDADRGTGIHTAHADTVWNGGFGISACQCRPALQRMELFPLNG